MKRLFGNVGGLKAGQIRRLEIFTADAFLPNLLSLLNSPGISAAFPMKHAARSGF